MAGNEDFKDIEKDVFEDMVAEQINEDELAKADLNSTEAAESENSEETAVDENSEETSVDDGFGETASEEQAEGDEKEKKSFFKKKDKKDKKDEKIEELTDKYLRLMAEFDNYRKRTEKEKSQMFEIGARDIIEKILPTIDNFERGLAAATLEEKETAFVQGIEKIYKQLLTSLESAGVKQIESVGKEFSPDFHNAVMHTEDPELGENIVAEEFQKGYMYRDTVVRHSMVRVAN